MIEQDISSELRARKELVERIVSSDLICKSARLRELFLYLCRRVLDESAEHINELELGHRVFGKPQFYDTTADNTVRVHASTLRKRLAEYFQTQGREEPVVIEIPRGNYAPLFKVREPPVRTEVPRSRDLMQASDPLYNTPTPINRPQDLPATPLPHKRTWNLWIIPLLLGVLVGAGPFLVLRTRAGSTSGRQEITYGRAVRTFWSGLFVEGATVQVVLDDASLDFYQQLTQEPVKLAEYFDRSYLNLVDQRSLAAHLDPKLMRSFLLRRQSNFAYANVVGRLEETAVALGSHPATLLSRDFSFRQLKSGNVLLLGTSQSNPWIQAFEPHLALRWKLDSSSGAYFPADSTLRPEDQDRYRPSADPGKPREGYATVAFLPGLGTSGNVLIISGTGGSAVAAAIDFLMDERSIEDIRSRLHGPDTDPFPSFEVLLEVQKGANLPRSVVVLVCRAPLAQDSARPGPVNLPKP